MASSVLALTIATLLKGNAAAGDASAAEKGLIESNSGRKSAAADTGSGDEKANVIPSASVQKPSAVREGRVQTAPHCRRRPHSGWRCCSACSAGASSKQHQQRPMPCLSTAPAQTLLMPTALRRTVQQMMHPDCSKILRCRDRASAMTHQASPQQLCRSKNRQPSHLALPMTRQASTAATAERRLRQCQRVHRVPMRPSQLQTLQPTPHQWDQPAQNRRR